MTARSNDILLVHPGKQHAYEVAVALQEHGRLLRFVTGVYDGPSSWLTSVARSVPSGEWRERVERQLAKRRHSGLDPDRVTSWPAAEIVSRTVGRTRLASAITGGRSGYLFANWSCDRAVARELRRQRWRPYAVYAFLGAARETFAACRELGIRTILDVPTSVAAIRGFVDERIAFGLRAHQPSISPRQLLGELAGADLIVTPSVAAAQSIREAGYRGLIAEVAFGVDLDLFAPRARPGGRAFRAVFAGRLELLKGVHYLLRAWRDAAVSGELVLAGSPGEAEFVTRIRAQYPSSVRETGNLSRSELAALLSDADVFVMPSLAEGSALVTYEALASGLPSVVTRESGSIVRDGVEGFVVAATDCAAMADRIRELHRNPELRKAMSIAARGRAEEFSWPSYRRRLIAAIDSGLASPQVLQCAIA